MPNPFSDFWDFLIGNTDDHNALGAWKYLFVALFLALIVMFLFALHAAGRSLGLDAWLRRHIPSVRDGSGLFGKLLNIAG